MLPALLALSTVAHAAPRPRGGFFFGTEPDLSELPRDSRLRLGGDEGSRPRRVDVQPQLQAPFRPWLQGASVAWSPEGVWVADTENDSLVLSSADGKRLLRTIPLGAGAAPEQVVVGPDGRAFVTLRGVGRVAAIAPGATLPTSTAPTGLEPFGLALSADGRTLFVSVARAGEVVAYDAASLTEKSRVGVDADPRGLAATPDGEKLFVAHLTGRSVSVIDLSRGAQVRRIPLVARDRLVELTGAPTRLPNLTFALALSPSGRRVFVPHALEDTGAQVAPEVRSGGYGAGTAQPVVATVTTLDADAEEPRGAARANGRFGFALNGMSQLRAAIVDPERTRLFVAALGSDEIRALNTSYIDPAFGGTEASTFLGAGKGPKGLAISPDGKRLYVHAALKHQLVVLDVTRARSSMPRLAALTVGPERLPPAAAHGRQLFFTSRDPRISSFGQFACATCHPEGRQDGLTWRLDKGPRQTPILAGRLVGTAPYNWLGTRGSLKDNMKETMGRLGGSGLKGKDLDDLELYLTQYLDPGPAPVAAHTGLVERGKALFESDDVGCVHCHAGGRFTDGKNHDVGTTTTEEVAHLKIARGEAVAAERPDPVRLASALVGWTSTGGLLRLFSGRPLVEDDELFTGLTVAISALSAPSPSLSLLALQLRSRSLFRQSSFGMPGSSLARLFGSRGLVAPPPAVALKKKAEPPRLRLAYNTPSLVGVGHSAPYFHDGSAPTLRDVVTTNNPGDRMGRTSQLPRADVDALVAYLETL